MCICVSFNKIKRNFVRKFEASFSCLLLEYFLSQLGVSRLVARTSMKINNLIVAHEAVIIPFSINNLMSCNLKCSK